VDGEGEEPVVIEVARGDAESAQRGGVGGVGLECEPADAVSTHECTGEVKRTGIAHQPEADRRVGACVDLRGGQPVNAVRSIGWLL